MTIRPAPVALNAAGELVAHTFLDTYQRAFIDRHGDTGHLSPQQLAELDQDPHHYRYFFAEQLATARTRLPSSRPSPSPMSSPHRQTRSMTGGGRPEDQAPGPSSQLTAAVAPSAARWEPQPSPTGAAPTRRDRVPVRYSRCFPIKRSPLP